MTPLAIALVLVSAAIHAGWNLHSKRQHPSTSFFFMASADGALLLTPYSGEELRKQIGDKGQEFGSQIEQYSDRGRVVIQENVKKAQEAVQEAQSKISKPAAA